MSVESSDVSAQLARIASQIHEDRTGRKPKAVTVVLSDDTLVITLHEALTRAETELAQSAAGAAQMQEFHRQLFETSGDEMRKAILRITGRHVREAAAELETSTGSVIHAFTSGAMVQVYLLNSDPNDREKKAIVPGHGEAKSAS